MVRALLYALDMAHLKISTIFATLLLLGGTAAAQQGAPGAPPTPYPGPPPAPPVAQPQPQPAPGPPPAPPVAQPQPAAYPAPQPAAYPAPQPGYPAPQPAAQSGYQPPPPQQGYAPPAYAPPQPTGPVVRQRQGWVFGLSLGAGSLDGEGEGESLAGVAFDMHVGFMVGPQLAILLEGYAVSHIEENAGLTQSMGLLAGQFWVSPQFWLKGGLGSGRLSLQDRDGVTVRESEDGVAAMIAAGYEILSTDRFALDVQLRAGAVAYDNDLTISQTALNLGVNWY